MPLLEVVGFTSTEKTFAVAFVFMSRETTDHYEWALERVKIICGNRLPDVITTNRELALINAIGKVFPNAKHIICNVHLIRNIEENGWYKTRSVAQQNKFKQDCMGLFSSHSITTYEERLHKMKVKWGDK